MLKKSISLLVSFIILLSLILFNAIILLNSTFIFKLYMIKTNIPFTLSIPLNKILSDYKNMISYLRNPFIKNLSFDYFTLSNFGKIHFLEVKNIFLFIYFFLALSVIFFIFLFIKKRALLKSSLKYLSFITICFFIGLLCSFIIDFNRIFTLFHKLFFNNDYWIFDSITDSIITVLPESFFLLNAVIILILLLIENFFIVVSLKD